MFARNYCLWGIRRQIHPTNNARTCLHMTDIKMDPTRTSHLQTNIDMNGWTINLVKINTIRNTHQKMQGTTLRRENKKDMKLPLVARLQHVPFSFLFFFLRIKENVLRSLQAWNLVRMHLMR